MKKKFSLKDKFHRKEKSEVVKLKKGKFEKFFYPCFYFVLLVAFIVSANYSFNKVYYENIYISGPSMLPTLLGGTIKETIEKEEGVTEDKYYSYYGQADKDPKVINGLKRFDVVIAYYPQSWSSSGDYVVKRVWGFPGETLRLTHTDDTYTFTVSSSDKVIYSINGEVKKNQSIYIKPLTKPQTLDLLYFNVGYKSFSINISGNHHRNIGTDSTGYTLKNDEFFIMGDNWTASSDCFSHMKPIETRIDYVSRNLIQGKVVKIDGYGILSSGSFTNKTAFEKGMYDF